MPSATTLPDRREILFGREPDLAYLRGRSCHKGLTAVAARPQMGKSWLLNELARSLGQDSAPCCLVGFAESFGETSDLFLRAVVDLYTRWLSDTDYWEQARVVWQQRKGDFTTDAGKAVGSVFEKVSKLGGPAAEAVGKLVKETFDGLAAANQALLSGGIQLPVLQYEQARDLVRIVSLISNKPLVIVLDQWEKSRSVELEFKTLDAFLHHLNEWSLCHVFLALRRDEPAFGFAQELRKSLPGTAEIYELGPMHLDDLPTSDRLVHYLRRTIPATRQLKPNDLLEILDSYPGTIYRWTSRYQVATMKTRDDLKAVATQAQDYHYAEFDDLLKGLTPAERALAIRLALVPLGSTEYWQALKPVLLVGESEDLLDDLKAKSVLEATAPPTYGHATRWEVAERWFLRNRSGAAREECESLILRLAAHVRSVDPVALPFAAALAGLLPIATQLALAERIIAVCQCAGSLFAEGIAVESAILMRMARESPDPVLAPMAGLLAMSLFNTLNHAKAENDLKRRDELLEELRGLAQRHPEDGAVREQLAKGMLSTMVEAMERGDLERRNALAKELEVLWLQFSDDPFLHKVSALAKGDEPASG